jgi:pyruvate/2-oxoglutarate dehydrogenase complex dihydrolipoamide dehydrogenase (E3) component
MGPDATRYDAIVIGSGQGGTPLARALAGAGRRTALIEREHVGGTCVNEGCTPTKTMVASARVAYLARRGADYGVRTGGISVDVAKVRDRKRRIVDRFRGGSERGLERTEHLDLIRGEARFTGPHAIEVTSAGRTSDGAIGRTLDADLIFINTGARPSRPRLPGLDGVPALDSTSVMELDVVPEHLVALGGGYIGIEFGQMFRRFGARVTIVQRGGQLLAREDPDIAGAVESILREDGIEILLRTEAQRVERGADGAIRLTVREAGGGERTVTGSHLLVCAGRTPNTDRLNLTAAGIQADAEGFIRVNDRLETNVPGVYCLGDAKGGPAFTHIAYDDFRVVQANVLNGGGRSIANRFVPYCVFMDPELGRVGLSETEARAKDRPVRVFTMPMKSVARAVEMDETRGLMKAVVDTDTQQILGCAILGVMGGEVMTAVEIAMMGRLPYTALRDATFAHPVVAESLNNLFDQ